MRWSRREWLASAAAGLASPGEPRNVLFIAADDMNTGLGCYGHPLAKTPQVDRLAAGGLRFDRAYCQFPVCGPSRASLLTGRRPDTTEVLANDVDFRIRHPEFVTLPQHFKNHGWTSIRTGKMFHMNVPREVGLPKYQDPPSWNIDLSPQGLEMRSEGIRGNPTPKLPSGNAFEWVRTPSAQGQADTNAADQAIEMLEKYGKERFFLAVGFVRPHVPFVAPSRFYDLYPADQVGVARNPPGDTDDIPLLSRKVQPERWDHAGMSESEQREARRGYLASTSFMDEQLGRVMGALGKMKLAKKTIVVFWGDHGYHLGEHTRWAKMTLMEQGAHVPLLIAAPGHRAGVCRGLVEFVDIYPTLSELCGLAVPEGLEGTSMVPLLRDPRRPWKRAAFTQLRSGTGTVGRTVRTDRYRYIHWQNGADTAEEFYDHLTDDGEFTNLASSPAHADVLSQHRAILAAGWKAARPSP